MALKYTKIPRDTFQHVQINAGIILTEFDPFNPTIDTTKIIGATSGGIEFTAEPEYSDYGEDIDNVPNNSKQLKRLTSIEATMSGTFVSVNAEAARKLVGAADIAVSSEGVTAILPRQDLNYGTPISDTSVASPDDFTTLWFVGDYSEFNSGTSAGFIAIKLENALNNAGFSMQTSKDDKGEFEFEFVGHYDLNNVDKIPYEIYVKEGDNRYVVKADYTALKNHLSVGDKTTGVIALDRDLPIGAHIEYHSSDPTIATVTVDSDDPNVKSEITAVSEGSCYIHAVVIHTPAGADDPPITYGEAKTQIIVSL